MKTVRPKKNLGQHFLVDLNIAKRIADTVDACPDLPVLEIGPGMGVLTQFLIPKPRPVKAVEIDRESVAYLKSTLFRDAISHPSSGIEPPSGAVGGALIEGDFLRMDLTQIFGGQPFVLTGNYPYDISSQIFFKMLDNKELIPCCTGMIQHEVAVRMAAQPGNKQYGILSVLIQAWYRPRLRLAPLPPCRQDRLQPAPQDAPRLAAPAVRQRFFTLYSSLFTSHAPSRAAHHPPVRRTDESCGGRVEPRV